jgi:hypothetical protein
MKQYSFHSLSSSLPEGRVGRNILRPSHHQLSALFEKVTEGIMRIRRSVSAVKRPALVAVVSETEGPGFQRSIAQVAVRAAVRRDAGFDAVGKHWDRIVAIVRCAGTQVSHAPVQLGMAWPTYFFS